MPAVMPLQYTYRWLVFAAAGLWATAAIWLPPERLPGARVVYTFAAALLALAACSPERRRVRIVAAYGAAAAGLWRSTMLAQLQLAGETRGAPGVGAVAWAVLTVFVVVLVAYGWVQANPADER